MDCKWNNEYRGWALPRWGWFFLIFPGCIMLMRFGLPIVAMALLLVLLIAAFIHMGIQHANRPWAVPAAKRKREPYFDQPAAEPVDETPKRRPTYVVGDDGELVELVEEMPSKPKHDREPFDFV